MLVVSVWLAYQVHTARSRVAALKEWRDSGAFQIVTVEQAAEQTEAVTTPTGVIWRKRQIPFSFSRPGWLRRVLGDEAIWEIVVYNGSDGDEQSAKAKALFPEATVSHRELLMEPCHPGCFPSGTLVLTPFGQQPIDAIRVGDEVTSVLPDRVLVTRPVTSIFRTQNRLWELRAGGQLLTTTETQPLALSDGSFVAAGKLRRGDELLYFRDGETVPILVESVCKTDRISPVSNLVLGEQATFLAGNFVVRGKPPDPNAGPSSL